MMIYHYYDFFAVKWGLISHTIKGSTQPGCSTFYILSLGCFLQQVNTSSFRIRDELKGHLKKKNVIQLFSYIALNLEFWRNFQFCKKKVLREVYKNDSHNFVWPKQIIFPKTWSNCDSRTGNKLAKSLHHHRFFEIIF